MDRNQGGAGGIGKCGGCVKGRKQTRVTHDSAEGNPGILMRLDWKKCGRDAFLTAVFIGQECVSCNVS